MIGRKVESRWHQLFDGVVVRWEPLGPQMCDALVRTPDGRECWYGSSDLRPIDGLGPLPSRTEAQERNRVETVASLKAIRERLVHETQNGPRWQGCDFGKAHLGRAIDGALADLQRCRGCGDPSPDMLCDACQNDTRSANCPDCYGPRQVNPAAGED